MCPVSMVSGPFQVSYRPYQLNRTKHQLDKFIFSGVLAYNVSKAALDQFTRCVSLELAAKQIRVNSVNPGVIVTELQKRGGLDTERYEKFLEHSKTTHALGRPGEATEVKLTTVKKNIVRHKLSV